MSSSSEVSCTGGRFFLRGIKGGFWAENFLTEMAANLVGIVGCDSDIVEVEEDVIDDLAAWEYDRDKGEAINFRASNFHFGQSLESAV
ncbi:UNVERIFIED_CONTAM: hypothetical protein NCL1_32692 [Trichonephila clavipes]